MQDESDELEDSQRAKEKKIHADKPDEFQDENVQDFLYLTYFALPCSTPQSAELLLHWTALLLQAAKADSAVGPYGSCRQSC